MHILKITDKNILDTFDLKKTFECGQCFRWDEIEKNKFIGVTGEKVFEIHKFEDRIDIFASITENNISEKEIEKLRKYIINYLDLERDYKKIEKIIIENTSDIFKKEMTEAVEDGKGIRILNQDIFETIITYIISANNNIPRIKSLVNKLSEKYGKKIEYNGKIYYTFPDEKMLKDVTREEYRSLGVGFRDIRLFETVNKINNNGIKKYIENKESLKELSGVGDKVAECIMLFSLNKINTFPIDVWVRRVVNDIYFKKEDEKKIKRKDIEKFGEEFFGGYSGLAQEYLFYWRRNKKQKNGD